MNDLISREQAIAHLKKRLIETAINNTGVRALCDSIFADTADNRIEPWINEIPSAEKTGKWIPITSRTKDGREKMQWGCSECGQVMYQFGQKFCSGCGARMVDNENL